MNYDAKIPIVLSVVELASVVVKTAVVIVVGETVDSSVVSVLCSGCIANLL